MKKVHLFCLAFVSLLLCSCDQKEFEHENEAIRGYHELRATYDHIWHIVYEDGPDWETLWDEDKYLMSYESLLPHDPEGLRAILYLPSGSYDEYNFPTYGGTLDVNAGKHSILLYNNDTEYVLFNEVYNQASVMATTRSRSRSSFMGLPFIDVETNENTINTPDMLYACNGGEFVSELKQDNEPLSYQLKPLVYKYLVRYHFTSGLQHVVLARGALAGLASSVYLSDGHTGVQRGTFLYDIELSECKQVTDSVQGCGVLYAIVNSFGVAGYPNDYYSRSDQTFGLNIEIRLNNGDIQSFDFDISEQVLKQPRGGVIEVQGIEVSYKEESEPQEGGAFEVEIDGWGPHYDIII